MGRTIAAVLAVAVLVGCTSGAAAGGSAAPSVDPVAWQECGPNLDCATVDVPVVHTDPDGPTIGLAVVRHRATDPARRIGSLLTNPGGPGGPAAEGVRMIGTPMDPGSWSPELLARFDIVGMDPRGVGGSAGIRCLSDAHREENLGLDLDPALAGGLPRDVVDAEARELADGCASGVDPVLLANMATDDVARDMDVVRAALGEDRISYLGVSYGTLLGATYASLFPDRVRHMVLDAPADPVLWQQDPLAATAAQAVGGERMLDLWFATCRDEGAACPFGDGDPAAAFDALVAQLEAAPLEVPASDGVAAGRVDGASVLLGARTAMFGPALWPVLSAGLVLAQNGDGSLLLTLSQLLVREPDGSPAGFAEANFAVNCLDRAVPTDVAAHERNAAEIAAAAPRFGALSGLLLLPCAQWPAQNADRYTGPLTGAGAPPILVVGGREDSQTPYPWAEAMGVAGVGGAAHPRGRRARVVPHQWRLRRHGRRPLPDRRHATRGRHHLRAGAGRDHGAACGVIGGQPAVRRKRLTSALNASGASRFAAWPTPGSHTSSEPGMAACSASATGRGARASASP